MSGVRSGGDKLAQALHQERAELILALNGNQVNGEMAWQIIHRWDALVEIAEAAQPMADLPWPLSADERQEWIVKQNRLRSALARLDRPSSDPRADGGAFRSGTDTTEEQT